MKKKLALILSIIFSFNLYADEGMWVLTMLDKLQIQAKGCKLTPEQIYSINQSSLKDAIIGLGSDDRPLSFFCTAELVSPEGLVFTNYHCAFDMIQKHTTLSANYIEHGYWAKNKQEELPNPGITASIVQKIIDVTDQFHDVFLTQNLSKSTLDSLLNDRKDAIIKSVTDTSNYAASVKGFYEDNQFLLFIYNTYSDIRLVGAPPRTIGKYGDETDNWVWPRHTGDFCVLRLYAGQNNEPATYKDDNKPYNPLHFLPISLKGYENGDFAMVMGFPGSTDRYATSSGVESIHTYNNQPVVTIGDAVLGVYKSFMNSDSLVKIKYAAKYDRISNYWKYAKGQINGVNSLNVLQKKKLHEEQFLAWATEQPDSLQEIYTSALESIHTYHNTTHAIKEASTYYNVGILNVVELCMFVYESLSFLDAVESGDTDQYKQGKAEMVELMNEHFKNYDVRVDKAQFIALSTLINSHVHQLLQPSYIQTVTKKDKGNFEKYANKIFDNSMFANQQAMQKFIENPSSKAFFKDPGFELLKSVLQAYFLTRNYLESVEYSLANRTFLHAMQTQYPDSVFYPDANSTLRFTYGYVGDYIPRDAVHYRHYTTLQGVFEKENPLDEDFQVPQKLRELYAARDYGQYADKNGELPLCFITNNDITGGNSGSPVMNADGELIGLAFDGNWEAMSSDIIFERNYQKCIAVDVRYVLFVIDKFAGAGYLLDEMKLVK